MDKIDKALNKFSAKEKLEVKDIFLKIKSGNLKELNIKKLRGRNDVFRVRKGNLRVIYRTEESKIFILSVGRRSESTYKF